MAFKIEESFEVEAPMTQVWEYLIDPQRVVVCLPGAELTNVIDEHTYAGRVRVKVGPVKAAYKGTVRLEEVNEGEHLMRLTGEGKETAGAGSAKLAMRSQLSPAASEKTRVDVEADIDIAGKMARFGRGVMEDVSRQLFRQFALNMQEAFSQPVTGDQTSTVAAPTPPSPAASDRVDETVQQAPSPTEHQPASSHVTPSEEVRATTQPTPTRPVSVLALIGRAIVSRVKRLFGM